VFLTQHDSNVCTCSKCINSTSGHKSITENEFGDIDFLYDVEILAAWHCFSSILMTFIAHVPFQPYYYFRFKILHHIWIQRNHFPINTRSLPVHHTIFGDFYDDNVCACAVSTWILRQIANLLSEMHSATLISYEMWIFCL